MAAALIFGVDIVAGMLTLAYVGKLLFTGEEAAIHTAAGNSSCVEIIKKSLLNQNIQPKRFR